MSRAKTYGLVLVLLTSAALSSACTRTDATGPSEQSQPSLETLGGNNKPAPAPSFETLGGNN
jgi:hypothetical protein